MTLLKATLILLYMSSINGFTQNECVKDFEEKYNAGEYQAAITISKTCSEINSNTELSYFKARSLMYLKDYEKAIPTYRALLVTNNKNVDYLNGLGAAYYMLNQNDSALVYYSKTLALDPEHINALMNRTNLFFMGYQYDKALLDAQNLVKIEPNNSNHWVDLGDIYSYLDKDTNSIEAYHKALAVNPKNSDVYLSLAEHYSLSEDYEKAHIYVNKGISIKKDDPLLYAVKGDAFYFQDDSHYKEALKAYLKSLKLEEDTDVAYYAGLCYEELGEFKSAEIYYRKAIDLGSEDAKCYSDLAYLIYKDEPFFAINMIEKAIEMDPEDHYTRGLKGDILFDVGLYKSAIESYTKAIPLASVKHFYYVRRASAYQALGDPRAACLDMKIANEMGSQEAQKYIENYCK